MTMSDQASILVVDDPGSCQTIGDVLELRGHAVETATQARSALEVLNGRPIDAVILDLQLPDVSGLELLKAIKMSSPITEVIIVTGHATVATAIEAINEAAFAYVTKPLRLDYLMTIIEKALAKQRGERALLERARMLETLIDATPVAIVGLDTAGRVTTWSKAAEEMFGWSAQEVVGQRVPIIPDRDRVALDEVVARNLPGGSRLSESQRQRKDGTQIDVLSSSAPITDAQGRMSGTLAVLVDVTARRQVEEHLRQVVKMEGISRLAGGIAHDFNNLLTVISGRCQLILRQLPAGNPIRRDIGIIGESGDRAASLTRQLLAFSRNQILEPTVFDLNEMVSGMKELLERVLREDIDLALNLDPSIGRVIVDRGQLEQVVVILAVNARDAMPDAGQFTLETHDAELDAAYVLQHIDALPGSYVVLSAFDSGLGMDAATRAHIFEPFFTTKDVGKGRGLGLASAYGILRQSHGHITVDSEPGRGTTFRIYLPRADAGATALAATGIGAAPCGTETILLVDDETSFRALTRELLEQSGYTVLESEDVQHALRIAEQHRGTIHLLLADVVMPRMNGCDLARAVQGVRPDIRVLYMSGYTDNVIIHEGILDPKTPFLQKSFTPSKLARKVREVLDAPH